MKKSDPGFTLVELIVAIGAAALVMASAVGFMLVGMRMERHSYDTAEQQQTARIVLTMTEKMAISGDIRRIENIGESWVLYTEENKPLLQYLSADGSLRMGNSILMYDLKHAVAAFESDQKLFTLTIETEREKYSTTVYCRDGQITPEKVTVESLLNGTMEDEKFKENAAYDARMEFLGILCGQYGSTGEIIYRDENGDIREREIGEPEYYSEWYIKRQDPDYEFNDYSEWNRYTPWCACFISWAAAEAFGSDHGAEAPCFANVDYGMVDFRALGDNWLEKTAGNTPVPSPGDLAFFSWDGDKDPEHVGVVLHLREENGTIMIYTIEGNSGVRATVNRYPLDSEDIIGYGVIDWKTS